MGENKFVTRIQKELPQLNNNTTNNPTEIRAKDVSSHFLGEMHRWSVSTWNDARG